MSRFDSIITSLNEGQINLQTLIGDLQSDQNLKIIYDVFIEHQADFEDKIKSPEEFKILVIETLKQTIRKLYNVSSEENQHLLIGIKVRYYIDKSIYEIKDVFTKDDVLSVKIQSLGNGVIIDLPLNDFFQRFSRYTS